MTRFEPGADEIVNELLGRSSLQRRARIVVTLPPVFKREAQIVEAISRMPLLVQPADVP